MREDGGPAFPEAFWPTPQSDAPDYRGGMSLHDYYVGEALKGMLCNGFIPNAFNPRMSDDSMDRRHDFIASAREIADALLKARGET